MFEETERKSIVKLVPAIFTEKNTKKKKKKVWKKRCNEAEKRKVR